MGLEILVNFQSKKKKKKALGVKQRYFSIQEISIEISMQALNSLDH